MDPTPDKVSHMSKIEILFGPIASGKSTYARFRAEQGALVANDDALVLATHGGAYNMYDSALKGVYKSLRSQIIHMGAAVGRDVIVDSTGQLKDTRDHLRTLGHSLNLDVRLVIFRNGVFEGEADGVRRYAADSRGVSMQDWIRIAEHHAGRQEPVTPDEKLLYDDVRWRIQ